MLYLSKVITKLKIVTHYSDKEIELLGLSLLDYKVHNDLGLINDIRLVTLDYVMNVLDSDIIRVKYLEQVAVHENKVKISESFVLNCDVVVCGTEINVDSKNHYALIDFSKLVDELGDRKILIEGSDTYKNLELCALLRRRGVDAFILGEPPIDDDVKTMILGGSDKVVADANIIREGPLVVNTSINYTAPFVKDQMMLGKGVEFIDHLTRKKFLISRDVYALHVAKSYLLHCINLIDDFKILRFEEVRCDNVVFMQIGLSRAECSSLSDKVRSSKICYRDLKRVLCARVNHLYGKILGLEVVSNDVAELSCIRSMLLNTLSFGNPFTLFTDQTITEGITSFRGLFENLLSSVIEDMMAEMLCRGRGHQS